MKALGPRSVAGVLKLFFDGFWYVLVVFLGLAMVLLILSAFVDMGGLVDVAGPNIDVSQSKLTLRVPVRLEMSDGAYRITAPSLGVEAARIQDVRANLQFPVNRGGILPAALTILLVMLSLGLWLVTQLRRVFRTLRDGRPFVAENASRIRQIGLAVILGELVRAGMVCFDSYYAHLHFSGAGIRFLVQPDLHVAAIVDGLIIVVVAEVFRQGTRLEEEQSLTV